MLGCEGKRSVAENQRCQLLCTLLLPRQRHLCYHFVVYALRVWQKNLLYCLPESDVSPIHEWAVHKIRVEGRSCILNVDPSFQLLNFEGSSHCRELIILDRKVLGTKTFSFLDCRFAQKMHFNRFSHAQMIAF